MKFIDKNRAMMAFRKYLLPIGISCASLLLTLYITQGILWLCDAHRRFPVNGRVGGVLYTWGHKVENNRFNFREREFDVPKPADTWRIMVLGDSLTWGAGLSISERYSNLLEEMLNRQFPQRKIEVLNFGIPGGPTITEHKVLEKFFAEVEPNLIVVGFCLNDPQPRSQDWSEERYKFSNSRTILYLNKLEKLLRTFYLSNIAELLHSAEFKFAEQMQLIPTWMVALDRTYDPNSSAWKDFVGALHNIKQISDSKSLPTPIFAVLNQSLDKGIADDYRRISEHIFLKWYKLASDAAVKEGYTVLDYADEISKLDPSTNLIINELDGHPSAKLNLVYAQKMFSVIASILDKAP